MNRLPLIAVALAAAALLLAGCYESKALLLDASAARQPVAQYDDWKFTTGDTTYHARLNPRADGWYDYEKALVNDDGSEGEWEHYTVLLNYLENAAGMDVYVTAHWDDEEEAYVYALVAFSPDGFWQSIVPMCDFFAADDDAALEVDSKAAEAAGAEMYSDEFSDLCIFSTRDSLFSAMRTIARDPGFAQRVADAAK